MTSVYLMRYFRQSEEENKKFLFNITFFLALADTILIFIGYVGIYFYFQSLDVEIPLNPYAWFILIALLLNNIKSIVLINFRIRRKALSFFLFSVLNSVLNVGLGLFFVAYLEWVRSEKNGGPNCLISTMLPICIFVLKKFTTPNFNLRIFLKAAKVAVPLVLASYAFVPVTNIDRVFLESLHISRN